MLAFIVFASIVFIHIRNVHHNQKQSGNIPTVSSAPLEGSTPASTTSNSDKSTQTNNISKTSNNGGQSVTLIAPTGSFVSNHTPGQNGSPTTEQSVCNTTSGATCNISFTNDEGITKNLGVKTTDSNGSAYWQWDISGGNLSTGSWKITATATLNNQTLTSTDSMPLEVQ